MSAHSPGPWRLAYDENDRRAVYAADGGFVVKPGGITSSQEWDGIPILETNERLIAAAPELLAELGALCDAIRTNEGPAGGVATQMARLKAEALIARVMGGPSA